MTSRTGDAARGMARGFAERQATFAEAAPALATELPGAALTPLVLLADDERELTDEMAAYLQRYGLRTLVANSFTAALAILDTQRPDAIILDQRLGPVDTLPHLPELRARTDAPILIVTGNREETDRVLGLELGADDFLVKPVSGRELVARLRARIRRPGNAAAPPPRRDRWRLQPVERRLLRPDGTVLDLTTAEFELLAVMAAQPGEVQTREALTQLVFRRPWRPGDRAVDNAVLHLRQKLAPELGERCIVTIRQVGYVFIGFPNS
ncbi:response regulator transcription factor [Roseomonas stagni]|uniref:Response regulator transcription factor n=1 Tax=Falsiroseomonas algicola TaxID=2716930 RepID=A0A6M1LHQ9_9PROT|nr:response regulator transcription factor [Falsiroseomonas algicola]NGM19519.1 response regulator transcription factor [Falsiroseomonas algicola]